MKYLRPFIFGLFLTVLVCQLKAQTAEGQLIEKIIPAPSLKNNLLEIPAEQPVAIYLPPSFNASDKRYPVVYFLPGFSEPVRYFTLYGVFQGFTLKESMDKLIQQGKIKEMIVVIPNGITFMGGSFYANSPVTGNWEDFIVKDVVSHIDSVYRTIPNASSRGIAGHSMGGSGALNLAMLHPEIFSATYGLSPGLFDPEGLPKTTMFADKNAIAQYLAKEDEFESYTKEEAELKFISFISNLNIVVSDYATSFTYAYGAAFSPNPEKKAPYIDYPYHKSGKEVVLDSTNWKRYENGFGGLDEKIERYRENLLKLKAMVIDYGLSDEYVWIPQGCIYFSKLLKDAGIPHILLTFEGGHDNKVRERIEEYILPFFSNTLVFK